MNPPTLHIIWGEVAVSRMRMRQIDRLVLLNHAAYDFHSEVEAEAFLLGVRECRPPETWMLVTGAMDIVRLGQPLKSRLFEAIAATDIDAIEAMLEAGVSVNVRAPNGMTPLHAACIRGSAAVVAVLLARGAHPDTQSSDAHQDTPLHYLAAQEQGSADANVDLLLEANADVDSFNAKHQTPLIRAVEGNNLALALHLVRKGANLDYQDNDGNSARSLFEAKFSNIVGDALVDSFTAEIARFDNTQATHSPRRQPEPRPTPYN